MSPLLSDIFMDEVNCRFLSYNIMFWSRYVDDILCIVRGTEELVDDILKHLNELHNNIYFTAEIQSDHCLNFLDLTLTCHEDRLAYSICIGNHTYISLHLF